MLTKAFIIKEIESIKPELIEQYHVTRIGLFGSYASGTPTETSDVDILIDFERPIGWDFFKIEEMLEKRFHTKIDLVTPAALKQLMKQDILNSVIDV